MPPLVSNNWGQSKNSIAITMDKIRWKSADKPGSVVDRHSSGQRVTTQLKQPTRELIRAASMFPYLVLLRVGFTLPLLLPTARCALTAPFQPYLCPGSKTKGHRRCIFCCTFRRLTPPRNYLALCPVEPGLSSAPSPKGRCRDCLADFRPLPYSSKDVLASLNTR